MNVVEAKELIQAFLANPAYPTFSEGIGVRNPYWRVNHAEALSGADEEYVYQGNLMEVHSYSAEVSLLWNG